jgi:hypothetical protein
MKDMSTGIPPLDALLPAALFPVCPAPPVPVTIESLGCPPDVVGDEHDVQLGALLNSFIQTTHHFFGSLPKLFKGVSDPRVIAQCDYPLPCLLTTGLLMFLCRLGARRQIALLLRNPRGARKMRTLCGTEGVPHGDTLDEAFQKLDPDQAQDVVCSMLERLIRNKVLDRYRFLGCFVVAVDGTGLWTFSQRHCEH